MSAIAACRRLGQIAVLLAFAGLGSALQPAAAQGPSRVPSPEEMLGFRVGADFKLARWEQIVAYFQALDAASDRVNVRVLGESTEGKPLLFVEIGSEDTIARLDHYRGLQAKLADPRRLRDAADEAALLREAKTVVLVNCGLHSTEVGASQMSMELAYLLATGTDDRTREILDRCIILLVPSANPDGNNKVAEWYDRNLDTPYEGAPMPCLYHPYIGHDNNRDWFMLTQKETQLLTQAIYREWYPSIVYDVHQMGSSGARMFVPPFFDPVNPNVHPLLHQTLLIIGGHMATELSREGKTGVIFKAIYDNWWQGGFRTTAYRHNMVGILTEVASANLASPVFQRYSELRGHARGLDAYAPRVNFPEPWPGGWWRLRDIVEYEEVACMALFMLAARYRDQFLQNHLALGKEAIRLGQEEPPFAYLIPPNDSDLGAVIRLLHIFQQSGIEMHHAQEQFTADGVQYPPNTFVLLAAQPFRAHLKDLMERQEYPDRAQYPGGPPEGPYDVAGWTLPLQMGVKTVTVVNPFQADLTPVQQLVGRGTVPQRPLPEAYILPQGNANASALFSFLREGFEVLVLPEGAGDLPPGTAAVRPTATKSSAALHQHAQALAERMTSLVAEYPPGRGAAPVKRLRLPRVGLYQPWTASMDEGWTRWVLEQHEFDYTTLHNAQIRAGNLRARFDCIIIPDLSLSSLVNGFPETVMPPPYAGGIGPDGVLRLQEFVEQGGTLVLMDGATALATEQFGVPVRNVLSGVGRDKFFCPGSVLRITVKNDHPLGYGFDTAAAAYFAGSRAFETGPGAYREMSAEEAKAKAARYPTVSVADYSDTVLLLSGWILGENLIKGKSAVAEVRYGQGRLVLFGFRVQHRGQPLGTFRFLFNAILWSGMEP